MSLRDFSGSLTEQIPFDFGFNPNFYDPQVTSASCFVNGVHSILEDLIGTQLPEQATISLAQNGALFNSEGTHSHNFDPLVRMFGLDSTTQAGNTLEDVLGRIQNGDSVLIHLDGKELQGLSQQLTNDMDPGGHTVRLLGLNPNDPSMVQIADPHPDFGGIKSFPRDLFEDAWNDTHRLATVIDMPDSANELSVLQDKIHNLYSQFSGMSEDALNQLIANNNGSDISGSIAESMRSWLESHNDFIGTQMANSGVFGSIDTSAAQNSFNNPDALKEAAGIDVGNILATGGYMALVEFYKDNPQKAKRITQVAASVGALDAFTDFSDGSVNLDFEINPLLVASMAVYLTRYANFSQGSFGARVSAKAATWVNKGMKIAEYGGYAAAAITAFDFLTGLEAADGILEVLNTFDFLDIIPDVADGADIFDGLATLGLGFAASKLVRYIFKKLGEEKVLEIAHLTKKTGPKKVLAELIAHDSPPELLLGPYTDYRKES